MGRIADDPRLAQLEDARLEEYLTLSPSDEQVAKSALSLCPPWVEGVLRPDLLTYITRAYK
eukprot:gene29974-37418_t